jgi:hypothetical protein
MARHLITETTASLNQQRPGLPLPRRLRLSSAAMLDTASHRAALETYLVPGERLLWAGRPRQGFALTRHGAGNFLFGLFFLVFAALWTGVVLLLGEPWFALFGLFFVIVGLGLVVVRPILAARTRRKCFYGVTDQRVLRLVGDRLTAMSLDGLPPMNMEERGDRSGSIRFGLTYKRPGTGFDGPAWEHVSIPGPIAALDNIENVRTVYDIIRRESERRRRELSGA